MAHTKLVTPPRPKDPTTRHVRAADSSRIGVRARVTAHFYGATIFYCDYLRPIAYESVVKYMSCGEV